MRAYFCFLLLLCRTATGQVPARPPSAPDDLCTIQGQVFNAATGDPVKKANLNLQRTDMTTEYNSMPVSYTTVTDASGKFAMKDIEAGKYRLLVNRNGFITTSYGARGPNRAGTTLTLLKGQHLSEITFRLTPHGIVTGRITDDEGEPLSYVSVQLLTWRYQQGRRQLSYGGGGGSTNDLGEYRIFGVPPGKYYLTATYRNQSYGVAQDRSATPEPEDDYVPTYFPGTTDVSTAAQVAVPPGGHIQGMDLKLNKFHTVHVRGHVNYTIPGRQRVMVYLMPKNTMMGMGFRPNQTDAKGDFDIRGASPGSYAVTAVLNEGSKSYQARANVEVGNSDVDGLTLNIGPGVAITGKVLVEGPEKPDLSSVRVMLQQREFLGMMFGPMSQSRIEEDRSFTLPDVSRGLFNVNVMGLPPGYYVKAIRSEQNDILSNGLNTENSPAPLEILISAGAAQVSGTVKHPDKGNPVPGATVLLIPQEKERKEQQSYYKQVTSDQNGTFLIKDLVPGEYRAYAWEDLEPGAYMDPEFMKPVETKGEVVRLEEKAQKTVDLTMIPAEAGALPQTQIR
jgi:hypothetical protein